MTTDSFLSMLIDMNEKLNKKRPIGDEFRQRIKNENLAKGSDYQALGKDFMNIHRFSIEKNQRKQNLFEKPPSLLFALVFSIAGLIFAVCFYANLCQKKQKGEPLNQNLITTFFIIYFCF